MPTEIFLGSSVSSRGERHPRKNKKNYIFYEAASKGSGAFCRILEVAFCRILGVCTMPKYNMGGCVLPNLSFLGVFALEQKKLS